LYTESKSYKITTQMLSTQ